MPERGLDTGPIVEEDFLSRQRSDDMVWDGGCPWTRPVIPPEDLALKVFSGEKPTDSGAEIPKAPSA